MALEIEIKIRVSDAAKFREELVRLHAIRLSSRHFEDNFVLDYRDQALRTNACLLRVRKTEEKETVTFKGPPRQAGPFKSREEFETAVESADVALKIFECLGLKPWFRYQKYREEYSIPVSSGPAPEIKVAFDSTPIGEFAELEGSEEGIREIAGKLGYDEAQFLRDSYYALFFRYCRDRGEEPGYMVFAGGDR